MSTFVRGDKEIINKFKALQVSDGKELKKGVMKALKEAEKEELAIQQSAVPVATGTWKGSLKVRVLPRSRVAIGWRITTKAKGEDSAFYQAFVDLGHESRKDASGQSHWIEGQHKMQKAAKEHGQEVLTHAIQYIQIEIDKIWDGK